MHRRFLWVLVVAATAGAASASAQEAKYRAPRIENDQPDLQGVWNFSSGVPLQRPAAFSDKTFFTKEESDKQRATIRDGLAALGKFAPVEAIGLEWIDNAPLIEDLRTSLISYPANGRLPGLVKGVRRVPTFDDIIAALGNPQGRHRRCSRSSRRSTARARTVTPTLRRRSGASTTPTCRSCRSWTPTSSRSSRGGIAS